jgi:hypothetical protein
MAKVNLETYRKHINFVISLGFKINKRNSIHGQDRDFTSHVKLNGISVDIAYCDPDHDFYEIFNIDKLKV